MKFIATSFIAIVSLFLMCGCYTDRQLEYAESDGYEAGYDAGYAAGYDEAYCEEDIIILDEYDDGFEVGYDIGYKKGCSDTEEFFFENHLTLVEALFRLQDEEVLRNDILELFLEYCWNDQVLGDYVYQDGCYHTSYCETLNVYASDFDFYMGEPDEDDAKCPLCFEE